jgi:hypothetical protein
MIGRSSVVTHRRNTEHPSAVVAGDRVQGAESQHESRTQTSELPRDSSTRLPLEMTKNRRIMGIRSLSTPIGQKHSGNRMHRIRAGELTASVQASFNAPRATCPSVSGSQSQAVSLPLSPVRVVFVFPAPYHLYHLLIISPSLLFSFRLTSSALKRRYTAQHESSW